MDRRRVKVAVLGAGTAGLSALREVRRATEDVVLIEGGPYGTTCARVGCMPSKSLIAAANAAEAVRTAGTFGIGVAACRIDGGAVMARVKALRDRFVRTVVDSVEALPAAIRLRGEARFSGDGEIVVRGADGETVVSAERVVIATGSRPTIPAAFAGVRHVTSDDVFEWDDLPPSVAVFGAGLIGLEIGQALSRLGVVVRVLGKNGAIGPLTDPDVLGVARRHFESTLDYVPDHELLRIVKNGDTATMEYRADGREYSATFDEVLVAAGRRPNVDGMGLETTSLALDAHGVPEHDPCTGQCGTSPVFIAGDAQDEAPLLHVASETGRIAGANAAAFPRVAAHARAAPLSVAFTEPQIALVGETFAALTARGADFRIGELDWTDQGRARVAGLAAGRVRVYADETSGRLLGAELFGPASEHLSHLLALALEQRLTVGELIAMPFYHPTFEEGLRTALGNLRHALRTGE